MEPVSLTAAAGKLIFIGFCLSVGFWTGKKITNKIDHFLQKNEQNLREFMQAHREKSSQTQES